MQKPTLNVGLMQEIVDRKFGSISAFAVAAGVSRQYAWEVVNGRQVPSFARTVQFAELLGVGVDDLLSASPKVEPPAMIPQADQLLAVAA